MQGKSTTQDYAARAMLSAPPPAHSKMTLSPTGLAHSSLVIVRRRVRFRAGAALIAHHSRNAFPASCWNVTRGAALHGAAATGMHDCMLQARPSTHHLAGRANWRRVHGN